MEFLGIYGLSDKMNTMISAVADNIFGIVWSSGIQIILFLAALQNIPSSAREAAEVEGATAWEYFWKITFQCQARLSVPCPLPYWHAFSFTVCGMIPGSP